jgi:hypothetical protein
VPGYSQQASSGEFSLRTPNAGFRGVSGGISLSTGTSSFGNSGMIGIDSANGHAWNVWLYVGSGDTGDGGDLLVTAGETTDGAFLGGDVIVTAGAGTNVGLGGGKGGSVELFGGGGMGGYAYDMGGPVELQGGCGRKATGGLILLTTGLGEATSSGHIMLRTQNAGLRVRQPHAEHGHLLERALGRHQPGHGQRAQGPRVAVGEGNNEHAGGIHIRSGNSSSMNGGDDAATTSFGERPAQAESRLHKKLSSLLSKAVRSLSSEANAKVDREGWLQLAKDTERTGNDHTCRAIVRASLTLGLEETDWKRIWMDDAKAAVRGGYPATACARAMPSPVTSSASLPPSSSATCSMAPRLSRTCSASPATRQCCLTQCASRARTARGNRWAHYFRRQWPPPVGRSCSG